jgi:hypothetical protein
MKMYCGIVIKKDEINITVIDEKQNEVLDETVPNEASPVIVTLTPHRQDLETIVIEADKDPRWLITALTEAGFSNVHTIS